MPTHSRDSPIPSFNCGINPARTSDVFPAPAGPVNQTRGACPDLGLRPYLAAVTLDDALHSGKTDARALELVDPVQTLERQE